jgi:RNA polymerase sigma-70 factor, ECF subfamily
MSQSFEQLINQNMGRIRRIAQRYAPGESEDLSQEILVALWRGYKKFRGDSKIETWVYRIAFNTAMTRVRKSIRTKAGDAVVESLLSREQAAPTSLSESDILTDFLDSLNEIDASVLMMYLDGMTAEEMEEVLGVKVNAINVRISRIKQKYIEAYVN